MSERALMFADYVAGMKLSDIAAKYRRTRACVWLQLIRHDEVTTRSIARKNKSTAVRTRNYGGRTSDPEVQERNRGFYLRWLAGETQASIARSEHFSTGRMSSIISEQVKRAAKEHRTA